MKAEDLRIGNFIDYNGVYQGRGITDISPDFMGYLLSVCDEWDLLEPIPLTEKWLIKFGFEKVNYIYYGKTNHPIAYNKKIQEYGLCFEIDLNGGEINLNEQWVRSDIKHVHQLQNLYHALTSKELEIKKA